MFQYDIRILWYITGSRYVPVLGFNKVESDSKILEPVFHRVGFEYL